MFVKLDIILVIVIVFGQPFSILIGSAAFSFLFTLATFDLMLGLIHVNMVQLNSCLSLYRLKLESL